MTCTFSRLITTPSDVLRKPSTFFPWVSRQFPGYSLWGIPSSKSLQQASCSLRLCSLSLCGSGHHTLLACLRRGAGRPSICCHTCAQAEEKCQGFILLSLP